MQRLCCIQAAEVAGVVGNEHEIALASIARHVLAFPASLADMRDMLRVITCLRGNPDRAGAQALVDQEPHDAAMLSTRRRAWCTGF